MNTSFNIFFPEMTTSCTSLDFELTGLSVISGARMCELEIESDDDDDDDDDDGGGGDGDENVSDRTEINDQLMAVYSLQNEVAVATHKTYILHMNASV
jgi:hypothetical protein